MNDKITETFISQALQEHGDWLAKRFIAALEQNRNRQTGELVASITPEHVQSGTGSTSVSISMNAYGRLMEIAGRRRKRTRNAFPGGRNRKRQKKTEWYNRNRFAGYGRLVRTLSAGISEEELQRIKDIIMGVKGS